MKKQKGEKRKLDPTKLIIVLAFVAIIVWGLVMGLADLANLRNDFYRAIGFENSEDFDNFSIVTNTDFDESDLKTNTPSNDDANYVLSMLHNNLEFKDGTSVFDEQDNFIIDKYNEHNGIKITAPLEMNDKQFCVFIQLLLGQEIQTSENEYKEYFDIEQITMQENLQNNEKENLQGNLQTKIGGFNVPQKTTQLNSKQNIIKTQILFHISTKQLKKSLRYYGKVFPDKLYANVGFDLFINMENQNYGEEEASAMFSAKNASIKINKFDDITNQRFIGIFSHIAKKTNDEIDELVANAIAKTLQEIISILNCNFDYQNGSIILSAK